MIKLLSLSDSVLHLAQHTVSKPLIRCILGLMISKQKMRFKTETLGILHLKLVSSNRLAPNKLFIPSMP